MGLLLIETNEFRSARNAFSGFQCHVAKLKVGQGFARSLLDTLSPKVPHSIEGARIFFPDASFSTTSVFSQIGQPPVNFVSLTPNHGRKCSILRSLTYGAIEHLMTNAEYVSVTKGDKAIYYIPNNSDFVLERQVKSGEMIAIRGFCPRVQCSPNSKSLAVYFVEEGTHRAKIPEESWGDWIGCRVFLPRDPALPFDPRGGVQLVAVSSDGGTATVEKRQMSYEVPTKSLKLSVTSSVLLRADLLKLFRSFNSFQYTQAKPLRMAMHDFVEKIAPKGSFELEYDKTRPVVVKFTNIPP